MPGSSVQEELEALGVPVEGVVQLQYRRRNQDTETDSPTLYTTGDSES
jgi:hypothetical protein